MAIRIQPTGQKTLQSLQWLRAIAALGVVLYHLDMGVEVYRGAEATAHIFGLGGLGVVLFFVLSGFVISMSAASRPKSRRVFILHRLARVYPAYLVTALAVALILLLMPRQALNHAAEVSWERLLRTLVFDLGRMGGYVYVGWTLFYEVCFYLIFALAGPKFASLHTTAGFRIALSTSLLACAILTEDRIGSFLLGIGLFVVLNHKVQNHNSLNHSSLNHNQTSRQGIVALSGLLMAMTAFSVRCPEVGACGLLLATLVLLEEQGRLQLGWKPMLLLGNASYSIYLVQVITNSASLKVAATISTDSSGFWRMAMVLGATSAVLAGLAMGRWIERPGTRLMADWGERLLGDESGRRG